VSDLSDEDVEGAEQLEDADDDEDELPLTDEERIDQLETQVEELQSELGQLAAAHARQEERGLEGRVNSYESRVVGLESVVDQLRRAIAAAAPDAWAAFSAKPEPPRA